MVTYLQTKEAKIWSQVAKNAEELLSHLDTMGDLVVYMRLALTSLEDAIHSRSR